MSDVRAPAIAFPRKRAREISRPRGDVGAEAATDRRQHPACTAEIAAAESPLLRGNSCDRCPSQSAQNPADADTTERIADG